MVIRKCGDILKDLRIKKGLTQKELAEKTGLTDVTIRMIELGKREGNSSTLDRLATFFNVSVDYLRGREFMEITQEPNLLLELLNMLVDKGIVKDINNIPEETEAIILNSVKQELSKIKRERESR